MLLCDLPNKAHETSLMANLGFKVSHLVIAWCTLLVLLPVSASCAESIPGAPFIEQVANHIQTAIDLKNTEESFTCHGEPVCGVQLIPLFYQEREFAPVWVDAKGARPPAKALMRIIARIDTEGLNPADYHEAVLRAMLAEVENTTSTDYRLWADLDVLLTDAFLLLSSHLSGGRVNPETLHTDWLLSGHTRDMTTVLDAIVTESQLDQTIDQLRPAPKGYGKLRTALEQLRTIEAGGGWQQVPEGPTLQPGERNARVLILRHRLQNGGDLDAKTVTESPDLLDEHVMAAVRSFQARHGLKVDGLVGVQTLAQLNVPIQKRIRQIKLNLERWRWLPDELGQAYIWVNTADFSLGAVVDNQTRLRMKVVVGQPARRTPVFSAPLTYLVINPTWTVPPTIAIEDMLPEAVKDPTYFSRRNISVYHGWDENAPALDPIQVDWAAYGKDRFPFRLVQQPGPDNALGLIKFMFPNKFDVYLHDTPNRSLFGRVQRDLSSGCIRVENVIDLAAHLLQDTAGWSGKRIKDTIRTGKTTVVHLTHPMPLHLLYMTAWVDENDILQFRRDIYGRDATLDTALKSRRPEPGQIPDMSIPFTE